MYGHVRVLRRARRRVVDCYDSTRARPGHQLLDTADAYGLGHNEELVGRAIRGRRDDVVLATKFGNVRAADGAWIDVCGRPDYVQQQCEASLKRLGVDAIDETVGAIKRLEHLLAAEKSSTHRVLQSRSFACPRSLRSSSRRSG